MPEAGHFERLKPLIADLARAGLTAHVLTDRRFAAATERAGGRFVNLFERYPLADADDESVPVPCRFVSFAARYAEDVARDLRALDVRLVVYDTFAVVGHVAARLLGVPYVNVCAGHNMDPARFVPELERDPRVALSDRCLRAVEVLRERHGLANASPFSYVDGMSPFLNVYCEPRAFLTEAERRVFEPVSFYGSLPALEGPGVARPVFDGAGQRVYVSFGTVVWRYWPDEALAALRAITDALAERQDVQGLIALGGADADGPALVRPNVAVARHVDQRQALREADVFVTHQGLNSTHEAVFHEVPMLAYPFFSDQPGLAARCRELGLSLPLVDEPRGALRARDVHRGLDELRAREGHMRTSLARARGWELETIAARGAVVRLISELAERDGEVSRAPD